MHATAFSLTGQTVSYLGKQAEIFELFDAAYFATKLRAPRNMFVIEAPTAPPYTSCLCQPPTHAIAARRIW
jgi:hypothetical protein